MACTPRDFKVKNLWQWRDELNALWMDTLFSVSEFAERNAGHMEAKAAKAFVDVVCKWLSSNRSRVMSLSFADPRGSPSVIFLHAGFASSAPSESMFCNCTATTSTSSSESPVLPTTDGSVVQPPSDLWSITVRRSLDSDGMFNLQVMDVLSELEAIMNPLSVHSPSTVVGTELPIRILTAFVLDFQMAIATARFFPSVDGVGPLPGQAAADEQPTGSSLMNLQGGRTSGAQQSYCCMATYLALQGASCYELRIVRREQDKDQGMGAILPPPSIHPSGLGRMGRG